MTTAGCWSQLGPSWHVRHVCGALCVEKKNFVLQLPLLPCFRSKVLSGTDG
ncbi:hypothetical protein DUNSADRAFT_1094 [Dunaliella salina]|uniref:Encoded protein n=1 Tax=Dunaliella salina TaxID=3046 RepID=A0ABQ7GXI1_DUNSA|nr:hypothetical protein DUNSADRAFT_1094 [Dunaliella salina]|eukprot:KAF5839317.1 hypothetical protein DUNSADRAFT_1094 [Dunaliella salina]